MGLTIGIRTWYKESSRKGVNLPAACSVKLAPSDKASIAKVANSVNCHLSRYSMTGMSSSPSDQGESTVRTDGEDSGGNPMWGILLVMLTGSRPKDNPARQAPIALLRSGLSYTQAPEKRNGIRLTLARAGASLALDRKKNGVCQPYNKTANHASL